MSLNKNSLQHEEQVSPFEEVLSPSEVVLFSRLNNHLLFHYVPLVQFWQTQRLCVTLRQFDAMLTKIKFFKGKDELLQMKQSGVQFVSLDKVLTGVNEWKKHYDDIAAFMEEQKLYLENHHKANENSSASPDKKRVNSKTHKGILGIHSGSQIKSQRKLENQASQSQNSRISINTSTYSNSHVYLAQNSKKQQNALLELNSTLIRTKHESHYELAIKMGQLNDICKKLKNDLSFTIVTKEGGQVQIIQKSNKTSQSKVLSEKAFQKKYHELKTLNNNMMQQIQGTLEKDLRQTLVQVMYLSDQLEKQIALLKRKGVNC